MIPTSSSKSTMNGRSSAGIAASGMARMGMGSTTCSPSGCPMMSWSWMGNGKASTSSSKGMSSPKSGKAEG
ncbi:hypothetical protein HanIR_Chr09g0407821 [Helianthus annuus]|nr:hypothetical protein HanIR_Chr09g0407821 [Helianthus annuus]